MDIRETNANKRGLFLIELLIGIAIIGAMLAAILPLMQDKEPGHERKQFVTRLNELMQFGWQQSIITHAVHRVLFDFQERTATLERNITNSPTEKKLDFEKVKNPSGPMRWPKDIEIKQFIIGGYDEMRRFSRGGAQTSWFYIIPDGMTQLVTINGIDKADTGGGKPAQFGLVLNPYLAQFKVYDAYQK